MLNYNQNKLIHLSMLCIFLLPYFVFSTICNGSTGKRNNVIVSQHKLNNYPYIYTIHDKATQHKLGKQNKQTNKQNKNKTQKKKIIKTTTTNKRY